MTSGLALLVLTALAAGIPFGVVITTLYGEDADIRDAGSGNIGATNVARVHGWRLAGPVLALDLGKGLVPVLFARVAWPEAGLAWLGVVGFTAFLGHCFSIFLELRGGKGVATGAGALLGIVPGPTACGVVVWIGLLTLTGRSSVAALGATLGVVGLVGLWVPEALPVVLLFALGIGATHTPNVRRLIRGEEDPIVRPVRWGRAAEPEDVLDQPLAGSGEPVALWKMPAPAPPDPPPTHEPPGGAA